MAIHFYGYGKCNTCRQAMQALQGLALEYEFIDVTVNPPSVQMLTMVLSLTGLSSQKLFNSSGQAYRQLEMKNKLPTWSDAQRVAYLAEHGRLLKRPIVIAEQRATVGYQADAFAAVWAAHSGSR